MHNVIFTEHRLMLMKVSNGKCNICGKNKETIKHLFWEWKTVKSCLENVNQLIGSLLPENMFVLNYKYMVLERLNKQYKHLLTQLFLKPSITFGCSETTGSLKLNRVYITRISKGDSRTVI